MKQAQDFPFFLLKVLDKEKIRDLSGIYADPKVYQVQDEEVERFDKMFPYKKKERKEGQLEN